VPPPSIDIDLFEAAAGWMPLRAIAAADFSPRAGENTHFFAQLSPERMKLPVLISVHHQ
jgi:hypothetical protein